MVIGAIDIAIMFYCLTHGIAYSSSLNIFAVIAGIFLYRGSLRAASLIRWFSVFTLCFLGAFILAWPFVYPLDLLLAQLRVDKTTVLISVAVLVGFLALLGWLIRALGSAPVMAARAAAGRKRRSMRIPAVVAVVSVVIACVGGSMLMTGENAQKGVDMARKELGEGYRYHTTSINIRSSNEGTFVRGVVAAWNDKEVRMYPFQWEEKP